MPSFTTNCNREQADGEKFSLKDACDDQVDYERALQRGQDSSSGCTSDSSDSGFQLDCRLPLDVESLIRISSETYFETLSVTDLKAILTCFRVQHSKTSKKQECIQLVTDLWHSYVDFEGSTGENDYFVRPVSLKSISNVEKISDLDVGALRALMNEHNIDCKDHWTKSNLVTRVKRLWTLVNADSVDGSETGRDSPIDNHDYLSGKLDEFNGDRGKRGYYTLHKITDAQNLPFSAIEYSKFKFGCELLARKFGEALAEGVIGMLDQSPITQQIVVTSSPYCFIPTATFAMKDYFIRRLNEYLITKALPVVQETKVHRDIYYSCDIGGLSAEERINLIGHEDFRIDLDYIRGKTIFFLDDIKISGTHESVIKKMYDDYGLINDHYFIYFAELVNRNIHPSIERDLNLAFVKNLSNLDELIRNGNFQLNARVVKYILGSKHEDFKRFIVNQQDAFVWKLCHYSMGNNYMNDEFRNNFLFLRQMNKK